jgi:HAD superfamily hydrolase (TIGR01509 family)
MVLQAVIFDMDGVIVDSHPIHKKSWARFLELNGKRLSDIDLSFIMDGRKREEILRHFFGQLSDQEVLRLGHQKEQLFRQEAVDLATIKGVREFLPELREAQIKLGVASSGSASRVNYILDSLNLRHYFEAVVTGDQVAHGKPHPSIFQLACSHLLTEPACTLVFEDSVSGVKAAKAAGARCVGVASNGIAQQLIAAGAEEIISDFSSVAFERLESIFH